MEQDRKSKKTPHAYGHLTYAKEERTYIGGKTVSSTSDAGKTG